jgi:hypothetical protein
MSTSTSKLTTKTTKRARAGRPGARRNQAHAERPQIARIRNAAGEIADAVLELATENALASERPSIRRVRRALRTPASIKPEFTDVANTVEALVRSLEQHVGPIDPRVSYSLSQALAAEASHFFGSLTSVASPPSVRRPPCSHWSSPEPYRFA